MKVFVTGASGFVGFGVAIGFRRAGHHVYGLIRSQKNERLLRMHEIEPVLGTIENRQSFMKAAERADVLVHCAYESSPNAEKIDAEFVDALIQAAANRPCQLIYTSGVWVYGFTHGSVVDEETPPTPIKHNSWRAGHEKKVLTAASKSLLPLVFRPGCVYGYSGSLTALWFASAQKGAATIVGDGNNHWPMIHLDDLAEAYVLGAEKKMHNQVLNLADGSQHTVLEMGEAAAAAAGVPGKIHKQSYSDAVKEMGAWVEGLMVDQKISSEKAERLLGWRARHPSFVADVKLFYEAWKESIKR